MLWKIGVLEDVTPPGADSQKAPVIYFVAGVKMTAAPPPGAR